jgi:tRNA modification GTPase
MFTPDDTIVAIATPPGRGGIGVVRISGPEADAIARAVLRCRTLQPRRATLTELAAGSADQHDVVDRVVATSFPAPRSYTGQHVVEISGHGSPVVLRAIVHGAVKAGARLARPGEFTLRAFLNGRLDLIQAEAVADLIEAATPLQARVAFDQLQGTLSNRIRQIDASLLALVARLEASLDFPDEGFHFIEPSALDAEIGTVITQLDAVLAHAARGRLIREGATVVIVGRPNVGKSSLFNTLVGQDRAIVTDIPGTTRDLLTEQIELDGLAITLVDTAGARNAADAVEQEGVERATRARETADLVIVVLDLGDPLTEDDERLLARTAAQKRVLVASKSDRNAKWHIEGAHRVSTLLHTGIDQLRHVLVNELTGADPTDDTAAVSNLRHVLLLEQARASLKKARHAVTEARAPEEFVLVDLHAARTTLAEIVGGATSESVLDHIFERFCIGK